MTSLPNIAEAIGPTPGFFAAPPTIITRSIFAPLLCSDAKESIKPQRIDSIAQRAIFSAVRLWLLIPASNPLASGRLGVRSPSK